MAKTPIPVVPDTGTEKAARLAADPHAAATGRQLAAEAVTAAGLEAVVADVEQLVEELVINAAGHTQAPLELTIDAHNDGVRSRSTTSRRGLPWGWRSILRAPGALLDRAQPTAQPVGR